jgi:protein-S-isoprenylcysteine O-methyltransferase Ste14
MMPLVALLTFEAVAIPACRRAPGHLALGTSLLLLYWLVEWRGVQGGFEGRVPRHPLVFISRAVWVGGLVLCLVDFLWLGWTPWQGPVVRALGGLLFLVGLALRYWSMRTLAGAFSYDLKVAADQPLVTRGPYRFVRHPSYTALILWSASFALWNPSWPGLLILLVATVPQIRLRIRREEQLLADHFGAQWAAYAGRTPALLPRPW